MVSSILWECGEQTIRYLLRHFIYHITFIFTSKLCSKHTINEYADDICQVAMQQLVRASYLQIKITIVTRSDKKGLIARNYMCLLNNVYLHFCVRYNNSVGFSIDYRFSINFWVSNVGGYHIYPQKRLLAKF